MIIFRYFVKEIYGTLLATTGILLLLLISNQFVHYLTQAATGILPIRTVMQMMSLQVPLLLGLLLPMGLFLGILMVYSRLGVDREMTVLFACGFSRGKLLSYTALIAAVISVIVAVLMLWVEPKMVAYKRHVLLEAAESSPLERIFPNQFITLPNHNGVLYANALSRDHENLQNVFLAQPSANNTAWTIIVADSANKWIDPNTHDRFLAFHQGYRYTGMPGNADFQITQYDGYWQRIQQNVLPLDQRADMLSTKDLWQHRQDNPDIQAELQWRFSLPLSVFILALLAVSLSKTKPRQGRYAALFPAMLLYIVYADLLFTAQAWLAKGQISPWLGMWWVHGLVFVVALVLWLRYLKDK